MRSPLGLALAVYVPHLLEEQLTGMVEEPFMVRALEPLAQLSPRAAGYVVFQGMLVLTLLTTYLFSLGGRARSVVLACLGLALVAEAHHLLRALATLDYNAGLWTAAPMPIVGALLLASLLRAPRAVAPAPSPPPLESTIT